MIPDYQISRNTLLWLFISQILVLLPHIQQTPFWVSGVLLACMFWRLQVFQGRWDLPSKKIKIFLLAVLAPSLIISFPGFFGLEALVSTLLLGYSLKLLEMHRKRDALIIIYLSFFIVMTSFLLDQGIGLSFFNLVTLIALITGLVGLYQEDRPENFQSVFVRDFRYAATIIIQALPLMILMFVVLPRLPSFWSVPLQKNTPKTGMSDFMSPGDFGRLVQSSEPVMRITFEGKEPTSQNLYWRGLVFDQFDGRRWEPADLTWKKSITVKTDSIYRGKRSYFLSQLESFWLKEGTKQFSYEVILEASQTPWLYSLAGSIPNTQSASDRGLGVNYQQLIFRDSLVRNRFKYSAKSYLINADAQKLPAWQRKINLQLPEEGNPESRAKAIQWREQEKTDKAYVDTLLGFYHKNFYYTLEPPTYGNALNGNSIDEFLFDAQKGFCEHFAGSFVFMLRAARIPARVVVGYQGGEYNPMENYYLVRQYDAHAWAEVWLAGEGWVRYDPTFSVAPNRILDGFRDLFEKQGELDFPLFSLEKYRGIPLMNMLSMQLDRINYNWARFVLSYDSDKQSALLAKWFGGQSIAMIAMYLGGVAVSLLGLIYISLLWQERDKNKDPVVRAYNRFCQKMTKKGFPPKEGESPQSYLRRVIKQDPDKYAYLNDLINNLYDYWYLNEKLEPSKVKYLRKQFRI